MPTPVKISPLLAGLEKYDPILKAKLKLGFVNGFDLGFRGHCNSDSQVKNLKSAESHPKIVEEYISAEKAKGRLIGPFSYPPFSNFQINPIGVVPKKDTDKFRIINDLSSPAGSSINDGIDKIFSEVKYSSIIDAIDLVSKFGAGCFLAKTDIEKAFRLMPIRPDQRHLLGISWQGQYFFDCCLPMGASSSCQLFEIFSSAIQFIAEENGISGLNHYLDDFLIANHSQSACSDDLNTFKLICKEIGVPLAPNKTVGPSQIITYLGIEFDTVKTTIRLPTDKLEKSRALINEVLSCKRPRVSVMMSLLGLLSFACTVIRPGRVFLRRLYGLIAGKPPHYSVRLSGEHKDDLKMWLEFLNGYNGIDFFHDVLEHKGLPLHIYSDASQSLGCGAILNNSWFSMPWPSKWWSEQNITFLELTPIVLALEAWKNTLKNRAVILHTDNHSLVSIINNQTSKEPLVLKFLRYLVLSSLQLNIIVSAVHISGKDNYLSDLLSRLQVDAFKKSQPAADNMPVAVRSLPVSLNCKE